MQVGIAVDEWVHGLRRSALTGGLSQVTVGNYARDLAALVAFVRPDTALSTLTYEHIDGFFDHYATTSDGRYTRGPAPRGKAVASLNRMYASLSVFFNDAQRRGWISQSPMPETYLARGKKRTMSNPRRKSIGVDGAHKLLDLDLSPRDEFVLRILIETGCRVGELCAADTRDIITTPQGVWLNLIHTKNGHPRMVPLTPRAMDAYRRYEQERPTPTARPGRPDTERDSEAALLLTRRGRRMTPRDIQNVLGRISTRAGVQVTPHGLRHTAATVLLEDGASVHTVRDLLGHSNVAVTSLYLDTRQADIADAVRNSPLSQ